MQMRNKLDSIKWTTLQNIGMEEGYSTFMDILKDAVKDTVSPKKKQQLSHRIK